MKWYFTVVSALFLLLTSCSKEKKFIRHLQSEWTIDKIEYIEAGVCSGNSFYNVTSSQTDAGIVVFTADEVESPVAYSSTDVQYEGYWEFESGQTKDFIYEISGKVYGGNNLKIFGNQYVGLAIELFTKDDLIFTITDYNGDCYYNAIRYVLSK